MKTDLNTIEENINVLSNYRKQKRTDALNSVVTNLYDTLKAFGYVSIDRNFISSFVNIKNLRVKQRLTTELIKALVKNGYIEKTTTIKQYNRIRRSDLYTTDYDSYGVLMNRNGFKTYYYKYEYDNKTKLPKRVLIGTDNINSNNIKLLEEANLIENKSFKNRKKQKVEAKNNLSLKRVYEFNSKIAYKLL